MEETKVLQGMIRPYQAEISWIARVVDALWLVGTLWLSLAVHGYVWNERYTLLATLAVVLFYVSSEMTGLYRSWRSEPIRQEMVQVFGVWGVVAIALLVVGYATKTTHLFSRLAFGTWFLVAPLLLAGWRSAERAVLRELREKGYNTRTVAIVGTGPIGERVARTVNDSPWMGLRIAGFFDDRRVPRANVPKDLGVPLLGGHTALVESARAGEVDVIYITYPIQAEDRIRSLVDRLADTTVSVYVVPDFFVFNLFHGRWVQLGSLPAVSVFETPFIGASGVAKRIEDVVVAGLAIGVAALPMLAVAAAIKLTSPGPVLFKQRRYGLDGREIEVWKFRSMSVSEDADHVPQATRGDPRVTRLGAFLRRTSMDELPQFFNVLQGTMSVVGPRPHALAHNEEYRRRIEAYMVRHKVKPGITGWAQVNGWRGETDTSEKMEKRVEYDLWYLRNASVWLDLRIVVVTLLVFWRQPNAY